MEVHLWFLYLSKKKNHWRINGNGKNNFLKIKINFKKYMLKIKIFIWLSVCPTIRIILSTHLHMQQCFVLPILHHMTQLFSQFFNQCQVKFTGQGFISTTISPACTLKLYLQPSRCSSYVEWLNIPEMVFIMQCF